MFNICLCGAQAGYEHKKDCPYPYYGSNPALIKAWEEEKKTKTIDQVKADK